MRIALCNEVLGELDFARQCDLAAERVQILLHRAQFRLARRFRVPADQRFDTGLGGLVHFHARQVPQKRQHLDAPPLLHH